MAPARLHKIPEDNVSPFNEKVGNWMLRHPTLTMLIFIIVLSVLFAVVFNVVYGMCTIESGIQRNFMVNQL